MKQILAEEFEQLRGVLNFLYAARSGERAGSSPESLPLDRLKSRFCADDGWRRVERSLADQSHQEAIYACNELRMRVIATALSFQGIEGSGRNDPEVENIILDVGPAVHCTGGVSYTNVQGLKVIVLPKLEHEEQAHGVYKDFLHIEENASPWASWVIDCSLVEQFPTLLLANVVAYAGRLRKMNRDLLLYWVRPEIFSEVQLPRMIEFFRLERRAGLLFSRRI